MLNYFVYLISHHHINQTLQRSVINVSRFQPPLILSQTCVKLYTNQHNINITLKSGPQCVLWYKNISSRYLNREVKLIFIGLFDQHEIWGIYRSCQNLEL